MAMEAKQKQR
jgi:hypothetical protein